MMCRTRHLLQRQPEGLAGLVEGFGEGDLELAQEAGAHSARPKELSAETCDTARDWPK